MSDDGQGDAGASDWTASLPEEVREWDEVKQSDDPNKFWEQMTNMRSRMGRSLTIPGEDAGAEDKAAFYEKVRNKVPELMLKPVADDAEQMNEVYRMMGMPEKADDYQPPEIDMQGLEQDTSRLEAFSNVAHEIGLNQKQYQALVKMQTEADLAQHAQQQAQREEALNTLASEWGAAKDQNMQIAENVRKQYFPFIPEGIGADTARAFVEIAKQLGSESKELLNANPSDGVMTPNEAATQLSEIMGNSEHPYWNPRDIGHKAARAKVSKLTRLKLGSA